MRSARCTRDVPPRPGYRAPVVTRAPSSLVALAVALAACVAVAACAGGASPAPPRPPGTPSPGTEPRLVVLIIVDQWPAWSFEAKRAALTGGFERLLREGEWRIGEYPYAATLTAPGHALIGSGEPSHRSGIVANNWWHRDIDRELKSIEAEDGSTTSKWLRVPGLSDAIAAAKTGGKAVSIALKDRAAIMALGHAGTAIWYDRSSIAWVSLAAPTWLAEHNTAQPIAAHLHDVWTPLAGTAGLAGIPDDAPGEVGEKGLGPTFPHALDATKDPADAIFAMALGNDLVFDTAAVAVDREQLGGDDQADLLILSLSAHDYVGHGWGHESWEAWDALLRIDRRLDTFLADLDTKVGAGRWAMLVTSDHGASPMPESLKGGRITYQQIKDAANRAAVAELGPGEWIASAKSPTVYLSAAARAQKPKDLAIATTKIVYALRSFPGIERVEKSAELWGHCESRTGDARRMCLALDPERSGEIIYLPAKGWILEDASERIATNHGSMQPYDRLVPVLLAPPGRRPHAALRKPSAEPMPMTDIATLLARWLGVTPPMELPRPATSTTPSAP
jgi:Type I phosphodiesterase / nucleotide pyrophosphatase